METVSCDDCDYDPGFGIAVVVLMVITGLLGLFVGYLMGGVI